MTQKEIAEKLNVSVSMVSRVVTGKDRVSEDNRKKILELLEKSGYQPNEVARSLKRKTTRVIGVMVPDVTNPFFSSIIKGIEEILTESDYSMLLCNSNEDEEKERELREVLIERQIAGLILGTVSTDTDYIQRYRNQGIPIVFVDNMPKIAEEFDFVAIDNCKASKRLLSHLVKGGHKRIAIINGPLKETSAQEIFNGYKEILSENGLEMVPDYIEQGDFLIDSGYTSMKRILELKNRPSAVLAANDSMAYGALRMLKEAKIAIPDEMAIVTFDANDPTGLIQPKLTTINAPAEEIGKAAGNIIRNKIRRKQKSIYNHIILEPDFIIGETCGCN